MFRLHWHCISAQELPGIRSTFGTGTELLNSLRLMYSRLASHRCPNGHYVPPDAETWRRSRRSCARCAERRYMRRARRSWRSILREPARNAAVREACGLWSLDSLVPDDSLSIDEGAVAPWNSLMWSLMTDVCREMGVRTDVPFRDLTDRGERDRLSRSGGEESIFSIEAKKSNQAGESWDFTYYQCGIHGGKCPGKGERRKGHEACRKVLERGRLPGMRRKQAFGGCHGHRRAARYWA